LRLLILKPSNRRDLTEDPLLRSGRVHQAALRPLVDFFDILQEMPNTHYLGEFELQVMLTVIRLFQVGFEGAMPTS
jgi:hypothetical protein